VKEAEDLFKASVKVLERVCPNNQVRMLVLYYETA
jgi:hypothetical protein